MNMGELSDRITGKQRNRSDEEFASLEFVAAKIEKAADRVIIIPYLSLF